MGGKHEGLARASRRLGAAGPGRRRAAPPAVDGSAAAPPAAERPLPRHVPHCRPGGGAPAFTVRRIVVVLAALALAGAMTPPAALAHAPTVGASRGSFPDVPDQSVGWRWAASTYPAWLTSAVGTALGGYRASTNSRGPAPVYASGASATVSYTAASTSPCSSVSNLLWLQCATNGGTTSFRIHVRDFDRAPYGDWRWWDTAATCATASGTRASGCWLIGRAMIHEAGHAIPTFGHDAQTELETVMRAVSPQVGAVGGDSVSYRRCDLAALQLLWDLANLAGSYADCFDHVAGHGTVGLLTRLTTTATAYRGCTGAMATVAGRLGTAVDSRYLKLADNPLAGRTVFLDRKRRVDSSYTLKAESAVATAALTGTNWSRALASPSGGAGTWDYRAHFDGGTGLDPSAAVLFSVTWGSTCPL